MSAEKSTGGPVTATEASNGGSLFPGSVVSGERSPGDVEAQPVSSDGTGAGQVQGNVPMTNGAAKPSTSWFMSSWIRPQGESGRRGFNPWLFVKITAKSSNPVSKLVNVLWPFVPAAFIVNYLSATHDDSVLVFSIAYVAMVPCANLIGFAGQEFARKLPHTFGVLAETSIGSFVEIIVFMVLLRDNQFHVIQAAILGSILATMLLCLGLCFFVGGLRRGEQTFSDVVSETGSGLLLTAGLGVAVPTIFERSLANSPLIGPEELERKALDMSRVTAVLLIVAYLVYVVYQMRTHHGIYDAIFEQDEREYLDNLHHGVVKQMLTMTECVVALVISVVLVSFIAVFLVERIEPIVVDHNVSDAFMGLILVPVVEKAAEHLTAVDEAWDDQMNFAMSHVLGATLQTALFNGPLVVIVAWGLHKDMSLNFEIFNIAVLILAILTGKSSPYFPCLTFVLWDLCH